MEKFMIFYKKRPILNPAYAKANYTLKKYEAETDCIWSTGQVIIVPNKMVIYFNTDKFIPGTI